MNSETDVTSDLNPAYVDGHLLPSFRNSIRGWSGRLLQSFQLGGAYFLQLRWLWDGALLGGWGRASPKSAFLGGLRTPPSANVPQQAAMELYSKPFRAALAAGAGSVMCAPTRVNNTPSCENDYLWRTILKRENSFVERANFFVISEGSAAVDNGTRSFEAGLDVEMPWMVRTAGAHDRILGLLREYENGGAGEHAEQSVGQKASAAQAMMDDKLLRILTNLQKADKLGNPQTTRTLTEHQTWTNATNAAHKQIARRVAGEGIVLLKNEGKLLPLFRSSSGRSGDDIVKEPFTVVMLSLYGCSDGAKMAAPGGSVTTASYMTSVEDGVLQYARAFQQKGLVSYESFDLNFNKLGGLNALHEVETTLTKLSNDKTLLRRYVAMVCLNPTTPDEDSRRSDEDSRRVLEHFDFSRIRPTPHGSRPRVVVYANWGGGFLDTVENVADAVMVGFFPGEQGGVAVADLLFGSRSPSGKLPITLPRRNFPEE